MARFATLCEIAGVSFTGCRVEVVNSEHLLNARGGTVDWANDNTPHLQSSNYGMIGKTVTLQFASQDIENHLDPLLDAVDAAEATNNTFTVRVVDGLYDIDVQAIRPFNAHNANWLTHGKHSEGWYETISLTVMIKSVNP